jgi:hypothetical protein
MTPRFMTSSSMTCSHGLRLGMLLCLSAMLCACAEAPPPRTGYYGPTLPLGEVIAGINQNNTRIPTLWARQEFEANIVDPKNSEAHFVNGYGTLLYASPDCLRLVGKKEVTDLFDMGTDGNKFWLRLTPQEDTFWWGNLADLDAGSSGEIPIRPDLILEVLGIRPADTSLLHEPAPVMRFSNTLDMYMIVWQYKLPDRWVAQKEIWYDRTTLQPRRVVLFDPDGRVEINAELSRFAQVKIDNFTQDQWPWIATRYSLSFPRTGSTMTLDLRDVALSHNGFPKGVSFAMPDVDRLGQAGVKVIQIGHENGTP